MTDTFAAKLGERVRLGCPITAIERGDSAVTVHFREFGEPAELEADYLVARIPLAILKKIPVTPTGPSRRVRDPERRLRLAVAGRASVADEVLERRRAEHQPRNRRPGDVFGLPDGRRSAGTRGVLMGSGRAMSRLTRPSPPSGSSIPGKTQTIEQAIVHNWAKDPWAFGCERMPFPLGQLKKFWPHIMEPVGRVHFAGCSLTICPGAWTPPRAPPTAWPPRSTRFETEVEQRIGFASFLIRVLSAAHSTLIRSMASSDPPESVATLSAELTIFQAKGN